MNESLTIRQRVDTREGVRFEDALGSIISTLIDRGYRPDLQSLRVTDAQATKQVVNSRTGPVSMEVGVMTISLSGDRS